jgi:dolichol-phosphate mannosyltransferase
MVELSVIVPTKDEPSAPMIIEELYKKLGNDTEIIVVDKSDPETRKPLYSTGAKIIVQKSSGYTAALMEGFREAHGDIISTIDPDGTYSVDDFKRVIGLLKNGTAGFASGDRSANKAVFGIHLRLGNAFLTGVFNLLYGQKMRDALSGSFAMKRNAFDLIRDVRPDSNKAGTLFFEAALAKRNQTFSQIPISYAHRVGSKPKTSNFKPFLGVQIAFYTLKTRISKLE